MENAERKSPEEGVEEPLLEGSGTFRARTYVASEQSCLWLWLAIEVGRSFN